METQNKPNFKVGDWIVQNMEIRLIKEMEGDKITCLSNGWEESYWRDYSDEVFPLTMHTKRTAESFKMKYDELYRESQGKNLNWPDIRRWFDGRCARALSLPETEEAFQPVWSELYGFCKEFREQLRATSHSTVAGMPFFRP